MAEEKPQEAALASGGQAKPAATEGKKKGKLPKGRHLSTIKRHRQSLKRAEQNRSVHSALRTAVKKVREAVATKNTSLATESLRKAVSLLDRAASSGIVHRRNASRHAARLSSLVSGLGSPA